MQEWNEMHHLKIMESLGGDLEWGDRFFGQHAAFFYYWVCFLKNTQLVTILVLRMKIDHDFGQLQVLNLMFLISPKVAYNFSELIEMHAGEFSLFVQEEIIVMFLLRAREG